MKLTIECTEEQANLIVRSLELAFRPLMNQWDDLSRWLTESECTYDESSVEDKIKFAKYMAKLESIREMLKAVGRINKPYIVKEDSNAEIVADMWSVLRHELYKSQHKEDGLSDVRSYKPIQVGSIPLIKCEVEK